MKLAILNIPIFLLGFLPGKYVSSKPDILNNSCNFNLHFMEVGFGSNMFEMEPVFKVNGTKFIYTSEDVWIFPGQTGIKDTLLMGDFRTSSIDSIASLLSGIKDSLVYKMYPAMSGSACYMRISNGIKNVNFELHNTADSTADKIVLILNSYIPQRLDKLFIHRFK